MKCLIIPPPKRNETLDKQLRLKQLDGF
jgi:hypothetical protein